MVNEQERLRRRKKGRAKITLDYEVPPGKIK